MRVAMDIAEQWSVRNPFRSVVWSVTVLALAACGGTAAPSAAPASSAGSVAAKPPSAVASASPRPASAPVSAPASAAAKPSPAASGAQPIRIGVLLPLTGPLSPTAKDQQTGFNDYLASINNTVAGRPVQLIYADTEGKPDVGLSKAKQLVENEKVPLLTGLVSTPVCYAIAPYIKQVQVPVMITADCGAQNLTTDAKFASDYLSRFTETNNQQFSPPADWAAKQGYKKAIIMTSDFGAGIEISDAFSSLFIERGGAIVQEVHPPLGSTDFGPYLAQLSKDADVLALFLPGTDGLRFAQQYATYIDKQKMPIIDMGGPITDATNLQQLGDSLVGLIAVYNWSAAIDNEPNKAFVKAWAQSHSGQIPPTRVATSYGNAQVVVAALQKVNGQPENKEQFLQAIHATDVVTAKGRIRLDKYHDIVQDMYVYQIVKEGGQFGHKILATYPQIDQFWGRPGPEQSMRFPFGQMKGKWVGMTKPDVDKLYGSR
jgi:branched-chain amino acid transport system substrate-binding protein